MTRLPHWQGVGRLVASETQAKYLDKDKGRESGSEVVRVQLANMTAARLACAGTLAEHLLTFPCHGIGYNRSLHAKLGSGSQRRHMRLDCCLTSEPATMAAVRHGETSAKYSETMCLDLGSAGQ